MAMAAANAVLDVVLEDGFLDHVREMSSLLKEGLEEVAAKHPNILGKVRGLGLLIGVECKNSNSDLVEKLEEKGVLTVVAGNSVIRFIPPLTVEQHHIEEAINQLREVCTELEQ